MVMEDLKEMITKRLCDELKTTRVVVTVAEVCCKNLKCNVCAGKGVVVDAATINGGL